MADQLIDGGSGNALREPPSLRSKTGNASRFILEFIEKRTLLSLSDILVIFEIKIADFIRFLIQLRLMDVDR